MFIWKKVFKINRKHLSVTLDLTPYNLQIKGGSLLLIYKECHRKKKLGVMVFEIIGNYLSISGHFHPKPIYLETHMNYSVSYVWNSCSPRCVMILKV